jgi:broad-specificity NMP kinase
MNIYLVTGANGVGKSTIIPHLQALLPAGAYSVRDFDERGVPENADGTWRASETAFWLEEGRRSQEQGVTTVVCGYIKTKDLGAQAEEIGRTIGFMVLDADETTLRRRLEGRYPRNAKYDPTLTVIGKTAERFISDNIYIRKVLKADCEKVGGQVIDTSNLTPSETAARVFEIMKLDGKAS